MKERLKTLLLFLLVSLSIFMTQRLWIYIPNEKTEVFEGNTANSSSYLLSDMITPNKFLLNFGQKNHTLVYDDSKYGIWNNSKKSLTNILGSNTIKINKITREDFLKYQEERSLVFYFPEKINTYILAKAWDVKDPNFIADTIPNINEIFIYLGNGDPFFVFSGEENYIAVYDSGVNINELKEKLIKIENNYDYDYYYSMRDTFGTTENNIYVPYEIKNNLPVVSVTNEIVSLNQDEKSNLAEKLFLKNIDYIREIVESNGSTIYVYNNRVLKLNMNGTIEYFHALEEKVLERNLYISLSTAADFIAKNTEALKGMYLAKIVPIESDGSLGYMLAFRYRIRGIPVLLGNREVVEYIQLEVFNNHIKSYKQLVRKELNLELNSVVDNRKMLSSYDVIDRNYNFLEKKYLQYMKLTNKDVGENIIQEVLNSIEDITIAYFDPNLKDKDERLIGVWQIKAHGKVYAFNAYTGTLVYER